MFTSVIIGCGRIGTGFDSPSDATALTHANAYTRSNHFQLVGLYDNDLEKSKEASVKWKVNSFDDFDEMMARTKPDVISICVSTPYHAYYLRKALGYDLKLVILEKPLTDDLKESEELVRLYEEKKLPILVNYTRRFVPGFQNFRERILKGDLGEIFNVSLKYSKGILNNGSHAIDLCRFLFGDLINGHIVHSKIDYSEKDPTMSLVLEFERCKEVYLQACDERHYSIFELDVCHKNGRTVFEEFGHKKKEFIIRNHPIYAGYYDLEEKTPNSTGMALAMQRMVDNASDFLSGKESLVCTDTDALYAQSICMGFSESSYLKQ